MRSISALLAAGIAVISCHASPEAHPPSCDTPVQQGVELTPGEQCFLRLLRRRCEGQDFCFVNCLTHSRHRGINEQGQPWYLGGGCFHLCDYGGRSGWREPEGSASCIFARP